MREGWKLTALAGALLVTGCDGTGPVGPEQGAFASPPSALHATHGLKTAFTATAVTVGLIDPGVATPTPPDAPTHVVIRGLTVLSRMEASDDRLTGDLTVVANGVLSLADGNGPVHGTFRIVVDQGGVWQGHWHGRREMTGAAEWTGTLHARGTGHGAAIDGWRLSFTDIVTTFDLIPIAAVEAIEGHIRR